ncbi:MAG: 4Fe-4S binding protein [Clostridiales bacterium]|nr:4Fe-4S binding protein [Clostridiales bacterium]
MPFGFGRKKPAANNTDKKLTVNKNRCPQNHPCPSVRVCPTGALTQNGFDAPVADQEKCTHCGKCVRFCPMRALILE